MKLLKVYLDEALLKELADTAAASSQSLSAVARSYLVEAARQHRAQANFGRLLAATRREGER